MYPILFTPFANPASGHGRVIGGSVDEYFTPNNIRRRLAAQALLSNTDGNGVRDGVVTYAAVTFLNRFLSGYQRGLRNFKQKHPGFADFTQRHPIMGNAVAWLPGLAATIPLFLGATAVLRKGTNWEPVRNVLQNKYVKIGASAVAAIWAVITAFPVLLGKHAIQEHRGFKQNLADAEALNPNANHRELKHAVKDLRNDVMLDRAYERAYALSGDPRNN